MLIGLKNIETSWKVTWSTAVVLMAEILDWMLHVNPMLKHKGMLVIYNPTDELIRKKIDVDLYFTGLKDQAKILDSQGQIVVLELSRDYRVLLDVQVKANSMSWFVIE